MVYVITQCYQILSKFSKVAVFYSVDTSQRNIIMVENCLKPLAVVNGGRRATTTSVDIDTEA